jgi:hypothetical protein
LKEEIVGQGYWWTSWMLNVSSSANIILSVFK